jgi:hypothetical protein
MIYLKSFLVGVAMFVLGFALVLALMLRQAAVPALPAAVAPASAEVGLDLRSAWIDIPIWPALLGVSQLSQGDLIGR